jgi:hypothetical protein
MDVSVVAAVGSFVMSERVLKPKATALFILGCILAYDLTTKTHDVSSLRVYRGEGKSGVSKVFGCIDRSCLASNDRLGTAMVVFSGLPSDFFKLWFLTRLFFRFDLQAQLYWPSH